MFDETLEQRIQKLKNEFEIIKSKGYIMSANNGRGNIGLTFEKLINKENFARDPLKSQFQKAVLIVMKNT